MGVQDAIDLISAKLPKFYVNNGLISTYRQQSKTNDLLYLLSELTTDIRSVMRLLNLLALIEQRGQLRNERYRSKIYQTKYRKN